MNNLRFAVRQLRESPGFTAAAVLSLAIGIGANSALFSVVNTVLVSPLPFADPNRLVLVFSTHMASQVSESANGGDTPGRSSTSRPFNPTASST